MRFPRIICVLLFFITALLSGCKRDATQDSTTNAIAPEQAATQEAGSQTPALAEAPRPSGPIEFTDVTAQAGIRFKHNSGAFGKKYLPETLGPGCAFLDYDNDGWQDILLINSANWPEKKGAKSYPALYHNNQNGTFTDVTGVSGLAVEMYGLIWTGRRDVRAGRERSRLRQRRFSGH